MVDVNDSSKIQEKVLEFLVDETGCDPEEMTPDTGLFTTGLLDSLDILKIVTLLENEFELKTGNPY